MTVLSRSGSLAAVAMLGTAFLGATPALADVPADGAAAVFREAAVLCARDGGALWGHTLCGPMLLTDWHDNAVAANQADAGGVLKPSGTLFTGVLPASAIISNTPIDWSGTHWTEMIWPLPDDDDKRHVMIAHELFHRIQAGLQFPQGDGGNQHLDSLEGRYLLQLEWRALAAALRAPDAAARRAATLDALLFRHERYRLFPAAAAEEGALELNEGVAEYTGVMIGLQTPQARTAHALRDLSAFVASPSFVRSFAYATGPAWGLLLNDADPAWRGRIRSGQRLDQLLETALKLPPAAPASVAARAALYDDGSLRAAEVRRDEETRARLAELKARLVDGPVLSLPLVHASFQFNPQTLKPLGDYGTVYPSMKLSADWGVLEVEDGALLNPAAKTAAVSAAGVEPATLKSPAWRLTLNKGWGVVPGARPGDLVVKPAGAATP